MGISEIGPGATQTPTVGEIEARRLVEQGRLDSLKTLEERNRLGQFATPPAIRGIDGPILFWGGSQR